MLLEISDATLTLTGLCPLCQIRLPDQCSNTMVVPCDIPNEKMVYPGRVHSMGHSYMMARGNTADERISG